MGKVILITGGSDGLGKTLATDLVKDNKVIILSPYEEELKKVAEEIRCEYVVGNVVNFKEIEEKISYILDKYSKIDILINNAGLWIQDELDKNEPNKIEEVINVNLLGVINVTKAVIPSMKKIKEGLIININSQSGITYKAERTVYNASKWGLTGFTRSLQTEISKYGIRVTDVMPGMLKTNMFKKVNVEKDLNNGLDTYEVAKLIRFIINTSKEVLIPEVGIKNINN